MNSFLLKSLSILIMIPLHYNANGEGTTKEVAEKSEMISKESKSSEIKIKNLVQQASYYYKSANNPEAADSILKIAINQAEGTYDNQKILETYNDYFECFDQAKYNNERLKLAKKAELLCRNLKNNYLIWRTCINLCSVYLSAYSTDQALDYAYQSHTIAEELHDDSLKIISSISIGACIEKKNHLIEAFRNYLQALGIADRLQNPGLLNRCYKVLSKFYNQNKNFDKAIEYKLKQMEIIGKTMPVDSSALMWMRFELEDINNNSRRSVNESNIEALLQFAKKTNDANLENSTFSLYRTYLINNEHFAKLKTVYTKDYPNELKRLAVKDPGMYFRIKALIFEESGILDSSLICFRQAKTLVDKNPNIIFKANFYIRLGQFYKRHELKKDALEMFKTAFELAGTTTNLEYTIKAGEELEKSYLDMGDYRNSYQFARLNRSLTDSLANISKKDELMLLEIDNAARLRDEAIARENDAIVQRHNMQYSAIVVILVVVFIMVIVLGSFSVPKWAIHFAGFLSLIFLFEFIILLADTKIHALTHGEPWKVLCIKIALLSILMPVHHYIERKVVSYLLSHRLLHFPTFSLRKFLKEIFMPDHGN